MASLDDLSDEELIKKLGATDKKDAIRKLGGNPDDYEWPEDQPENQLAALGRAGVVTASPGAAAGLAKVFATPVETKDSPGRTGRNFFRELKAAGQGVAVDAPQAVMEYAGLLPEQEQDGKLRQPGGLELAGRAATAVPRLGYELAKPVVQYAGEQIPKALGGSVGPVESFQRRPLGLLETLLQAEMLRGGVKAASPLAERIIGPTAGDVMASRLSGFETPQVAIPREIPRPRPTLAPGQTLQGSIPETETYQQAQTLAGEFDHEQRVNDVKAQMRAEELLGPREKVQGIQAQVAGLPPATRARTTVELPQEPPLLPPGGEPIEVPAPEETAEPAPAAAEPEAAGYDPGSLTRENLERDMGLPAQEPARPSIESQLNLRRAPEPAPVEPAAPPAPAPVPAPAPEPVVEKSLGLKKKAPARSLESRIQKLIATGKTNRDIASAMVAQGELAPEFAERYVASLRKEMEPAPALNDSGTSPPRGRPDARDIGRRVAAKTAALADSGRQDPFSKAPAETGAERAARERLERAKRKAYGLKTPVEARVDKNPL